MFLNLFFISIVSSLKNPKPVHLISLCPFLYPCSPPPKEVYHHVIHFNHYEFYEKQLILEILKHGNFFFGMSSFAHNPDIAPTCAGKTGAGN